MKKIFLWSIWVIYVGYLLLSDLPPGPSLLHIDGATIQEVFDLSLNFWFVTPALFPATAPVLHPALEGIFNIVVAWGLLFWGFLIDRRGQRLPMVPFLVGTAFLTNVFYLPWLALRESQTEVSVERLSAMERMGEGRSLPLFLTGVVLASLGWGMFARPEFGDLAARWEGLLEIVGSDRLAHSFAVDMLVFWWFQSWLVGDDMKRRGWEDGFSLWVARLVPFFGLAIYFSRRPALELED
ncbi:MAG: hypothetical protein SXA11_06685 [Cyanobacteriota bacterium]|nr:hypothetical protein [Cyanobacteriota bacterium]